MKTLDIKGVDITRQTGVSSGAVSQWANGIAVPNGKNLTELCRILQCTPEWMIRGDPNFSPTAQKKFSHNNIEMIPRSNVGFVPIISWVQAGNWTGSELRDSIMEDENISYLPCPVIHGPNTYALRVVGDSMTSPYGRSYPEGSFVYVDPDRVADVVNGDRVVAILKNEYDTTFKIYVEDGARKYLKPLNSAYPLLADEFVIIGKVLGMWMEG